MIPVFTDTDPNIQRQIYLKNQLLNTILIKICLMHFGDMLKKEWKSGIRRTIELSDHERMTQFCRPIDFVMHIENWINKPYIFTQNSLISEIIFLYDYVI